MARPGDLLRAAFEHHQAGRYDSAEAGYKAVLKARPDAAEAIYLYGMLALQQGRHLDAVDRLQRARALLPGDARITAGLGQALLRLGRYREARPLFRTLADVAPTDLAARRGLAAVALETAEPAVAAETAREGLAHHPADPRLLNLFGLALHRAGDLPGAEDAFRSALSAKPEDGESWLNLAVLLKHADRNLDALDAAERAVKHMPGEVAAHANLGAILLALDEVEKAQDACRRARAMDAGNLDAVVNLAAALEQGGRYREAAAAAEDGLSRFPEHAGLHLNLGLARLGSGDTSGAEAALREADRRMPDRGAGQVALGVLFLRTGRPAAAEAAFRAALRHGAPSARLRTNLSIALLAQARHGEALQAARDALRIDPDDAPARSHLLTVLNYADVENEAPETAFEEARAWAARHEAPLRNAWPAHRNNPNPDRRLRVGYLSPDLRDHAVARFLQPVLEAHDAQAVMSICYADVARPDATSGKLREAAAAWRHVAGMNPARIARLIEEDEIDVLVDLAGHTWARNMLVLARRPAPVQASWIGYPATTGLGAVGLRLTDARADQAEAGRLYSESLVRLDPVFLCWKAPEQAPAPVRADGPPTFASFNNPAKISPAVIETWAVLLGEV
ncbi:MAG: tetratricopeptide repeat protein, partial [Acetobacterales bacterium]